MPDPNLLMQALSNMMAGLNGMRPAAEQWMQQAQTPQAPVDGHDDPIGLLVQMLGESPAWQLGIEAPKVPEGIKILPGNALYSGGLGKLLGNMRVNRPNTTLPEMRPGQWKDWAESFLNEHANQMRRLKERMPDQFYRDIYPGVDRWASAPGEAGVQHLYSTTLSDEPGMSPWAGAKVILKPNGEADVAKLALHPAAAEHGIAGASILRNLMAGILQDLADNGVTAINPGSVSSEMAPLLQKFMQKGK